MAIEKRLQMLIEQHLETFLGVRFLATEHITGKKQARRIDYVAQSAQSLKDMYGLVETFAMSLGDDVQKREPKWCHAYRRFKNFLGVIVHPRDHRLVGILDRLIDHVGEDELHLLASLMEVIGMLVEKYEDEHVAEIGEA